MDKQTDIKLQTDAESQNDNLNVYLREFWRGILKFWWVALICALVFSAAAFFYGYYTYKPLYCSSATFTINTAKHTSGTGISSYASAYDSSALSQMSATFPYILQSSLLQEIICADLQLDSLPATISSSTVSGTNMFTLYVTGEDPQSVYDVLQSTIKNYPYIADYVIGTTQMIMLSETGIPTYPINEHAYYRRVEQAGVIGLLLGLLWIFMYGLFRKTIRNRQDVRQQLNSYCMASLPFVTFKKHSVEINRSVLITNTMVGDDFMESVRILRNEVTHGMEKDCKVIMVTSTAPGEGKTTVAANLALSLAKLNKKVLLLDADLRNPSVREILNVEKEAKGKAPEEYTLTTLSEYGIDILDFSVEKRKIWRIINVGYFRKLIEKFRKEYDVILLDCAPAGITTDPQIIAETVDELIYVIREDFVRIPKIRSALSGLLTTDIKPLGCVINGTSVGMIGYGRYGRYGKYGKYGRYGYGSKTKDA